MRGSNFVQGKYRPVNPHKYIGDVNNIVYRSSWELAAFRWFDDTPEILKWGSEELIIPYISQVDGRKHRYFTDAILFVKTPTGIRKKIIEIKPYSQTKKPTRGKNQKDASWAEDVRTWLTNESKWVAARAYADANDADFVILTEREIFPNQHSLKRYQQPKKKVGQ